MIEPSDRANNVIANARASGILRGMTVSISVKLEDDLGRDLDREVAGGNRSAFVAEAIREALDRRRVAAAAHWHASLTGEDAAALAAFDAEW